MQKKKSLSILLIILVVLIILTIVVSLLGEKKDKIDKKEATLLEFEIDDVTNLSWTNGSTVSFYKEDGTWYLDSDEEFPVDQEYIEDQLDLIKDYEAAFTVDEPESLSSYGLSSPKATIEVTTSDETYTLNLGSYSKMDSERYFEVGDGKVYLAKNDVLDYFTVDEASYIKLDDMDYDTDAKSIEVTDGSDVSLVSYVEDANYTYNNDFVYYLDEKALDSTNVESYLDTILATDLTDYVSYEGDYSKYGLDSPSRVVTLTYDDETLVFNLSEKSNSYYAYINDSKLIYEIDETSYDSFLIDYDALRPDEVVTLDWDSVNSIDITLGADNYTIEKSGKKYNISGDYEASDIDVTSFEEKVDALIINEFNEEEPTKSEEISLTFNLDNDNFKTVEVVIYKYDSDNCIVKVDGEIVGFVSRTLVVNLSESINQIVLG